MKHLISILIMLSSFYSKAQTNSTIEESFHESGKINVVVGVILISFIGIILYLIKIDRKISKLENNDD